MNIVFGTDGWRDLIGSGMNNYTVSLVAQAFADYCKNKFEKTEVAVGYDGRNYSAHFARLFSSILSGNGITAYLSDSIVPSPALSYYVKKHSLCAGVMITASHNPPEYNGVKFKASYGGPFLTEKTHKVEAYLKHSKPVYSGEHVVHTNLLQDYKNQIRSFIDFEKIRCSGISILVDSMAGAGERLIAELCREYEIKCKTIFGEAKENFAGRLAEPIEKNLAPLKYELAANPEYSFGAATDGDADRLGVVLDNGKWLSAQDTILLLTDYLVNGRKLQGNLVKTSSVTDKLVSNFQTRDRKVFDVQVGFKYICEKMISGDILFGCEESGGFGYKGHIPERDGILSAFIVAEMLASSGIKKLSEYFEAKSSQFGKIYYDRIDYNYAGDDRLDILPTLYNSFPQKISGFRVVSMDKYFSSRGIINGLKLKLEGTARWLLLRSSETEPLVRIYSEGESDSEVKNILEEGIRLIINKGIM